MFMYGIYGIFVRTFLFFSLLIFLYPFAAENYVGFADLPNQIYKDALSAGFDVSIMVAGKSGGGGCLLNNGYRKQL